MLPQNRRTAQMFIALWHSLETFIFVFCNLSKSPNDKRILLYSGILFCVKEFFLLWPTSILIRFSGKFYILAVLFIFVHSSWYSGLFFSYSLFYICFTGFWLLLYFLAGIPGLPRLVWELTFSESDTTRILNILSANFVPPFQFHLLLFLFLTFTFYFSQSRPYSILWRHYYPYIWK